MDAPPRLDKRRARLHFERAAATYDSAAVLQREVAGRLLGRLDLVKLQPHWILDAGSGTGHMARALAARYPGARVVALDFSLAMLRRSRASRSLWSRLIRRERPLLRVCGDLERLPLRTASLDMVCSNLALEWAVRPEQALRESLRVLARGGLLMFTTLGPDTLNELRAAHPDAAAGVHAFEDMHDLGDLLVGAGFADPVMDMERVTLTFSDFAALARELRASGCGSAAPPGGAGLRGRGWRRRLEQGYEQHRREGRLPATFEIVYGHAWKPEQGPRVTDDGRAVIRVQPRAARR
jgi:malonyl-CoA O-methyltransferase